MSAAPVRAWVALGANLGERAVMLESAFAALGALPGTTLAARSSLYVSAPVDAPGGDYVNAVAALDTTLAPEALLAELHRIEAVHGRLRSVRNAPRTLDLDLLLHGATTQATATLTLPHPRLHERAFVLLPLAELAPDLVVPGRGALADLLPPVSDQRIARLAG